LQRLKRNTQNLTQQLRTFENPIGVGTTVIRVKDCRFRNEISLSGLESGEVTSRLKVVVEENS
jgi:hypothetical protein